MPPTLWQFSSCLSKEQNSDDEGQLNQQAGCTGDAQAVVMRKKDRTKNKGETYKSRKSFEIRQEEAHDVLRRFPSKIPVIVERMKGEKQLPELERKKFLVPVEVTTGQLMRLICDRLKLEPVHPSLYLLVGGSHLPSASDTVREMYEKYRDKDNFLYVAYSSQQCYG